MSNNEMVDDSCEIVGMFFLAITMPIWLPIIAMGLVILSPLMLMYVAIDDLNEQKKIEKENKYG